MTTFPSPGGGDRPDKYDGPIADGDHDPLDDDEPRTFPADLDAGGAGTDLDALRREIGAAPLIEPRTWHVPTRPGFSCTYNVDLDEPTFEKYRRQCTRKRRGANDQPEIDDYKLGLLVLAKYNTHILRRGDPLTDSDGDPLTFTHNQFLQLYGVRTAAEAVRKFYGSDGAVISAGRAYMFATGWMDDPDDLDDVEGPTVR